MSQKIMEFYCEGCKKVFKAKGERIEFENPIYGNCWKTVAYCPHCKQQSEEYVKPTQKKSKSSGMPSTPSCGAGGCCSCGM